ncbi:unnamed protein product [Lactuca saligna]|uniref:Uncharacterized protein n=1 Tax=Lactuca saligna TaxID=75948 RepID=A0AA36A3X1_LACSI|nr:unnamed protein product [Lactuca saligna]
MEMYLRRLGRDIWRSVEEGPHVRILTPAQTDGTTVRLGGGTPLPIDSEIEKTAKKLRKQAKLHKRQPVSGTSSSSNPSVIKIWEDIPLSSVSASETESPSLSPQLASPINITPPSSPIHNILNSSPTETSPDSQAMLDNPGGNQGPINPPPEQTLGQWSRQEVAYKIIPSLVGPGEERCTISALELKILYAMTHPKNNLIPQYGRFLCHKLIRLRTSRSGKIVCGGIVSMIAKSAHIRAPYPGPHQPLSGEPYLTTTVLDSMRLFRLAGDITHHWTVGQNHDPKLLITPKNKGILDFRNPIHMTDWKIIPYIFPHSYSTEVDEQSEENEEDGDGDEEEEEPHHASPTGGGSSSHFAAPPPYHQ